MNTFDKAQAWLAKQDPAISGQGGHGQTYHVAATLAQGFELSERDVAELLAEFNQRCSPPWSERELAHKAAEAMRATSTHGRGYMLKGDGFAPRFTMPRRSVPRAAAPSSAKKVEAVSQLPVPIKDGARELIKAVFREGEGVRIAPATLNDEGREIPANSGPCLSREEWLRKLDAKKGDPNGLWYSNKKTGIYVTINPMKLGGSKDSDVTAYRHALIEFDNISREEQWTLYQQSKLPCAAIISSGGKSVHAWVKVDAKNRAEYDERVKVLYEHFAGGGYDLDSKNKNPSRLSRLPNCVRFGGRQELLALNTGFASFTEWLKDQQKETLGKVDRIADLLDCDADSDPNCVIGFRDIDKDGQVTQKSLRYLCRGKSAWLIGPSGIGKSSLVTQFAIGWAQGKAVFGIRPARPLKSLIIQAENDRYDLAEMAQGVAKAYDLQFLSPDSLVNQNVLFKTETMSVGEDFCDRLHKLADIYSPDVVWVDPLLSFAGIEVSKQDQATYFLRKLLQPVLEATGAVLIGVHHTGKPKGSKEVSTWTAIDWAYSGIGSSEFVNWARAVMVLHPHGNGNFELKLAKRGPRAGAMHPDGDSAFDSVWLRHSSGTIKWEQTPPPAPAEEPEQPAREPKPPKIPPADALYQVLTSGPTPTPWDKLKAEINPAGESARAVARKLAARAITLKVKNAPGEELCRKKVIELLHAGGWLGFNEENKTYHPISVGQ